MGCTSTIAIIGYGRLGSVLHQSWIARHPGAQFVVVAPRQPEHLGLQTRFVPADSQNTIEADVLVLCMKPQILQDSLTHYAKRIPDHALLISTAAGRTMSFYADYFPHAPIVRAMPNTLAGFGHSFTGLLANAMVSDAQRRLAADLFAAIGSIMWCQDDAQMDTVTALAGSGPAYVYAWMESFALVAREHGFSEENAALLVRHLFMGAAKAVGEGGDWVALRSAVTSKGGTTEAALQVLMSDHNGLAILLEEAVHKATQRAKELAQ